jgi:hypothetical protein
VKISGRGHFAVGIYLPHHDSFLLPRLRKSCFLLIREAKTPKGAAQAMHRRIAVFPILAFILLATSLGHAQTSVTAAEAKSHVGERATVCGKVVSTRWAESSRGSPTFLNFDQPYPDQVFTLVIWGYDRSKFNSPETTYRGKRVCVTGKISAFKGVPEVVANDPAQIKVQ